MKPQLNTINHWLDKRVYKKLTPAHIILVLIMLLSLGLHLLNASAIGDGNTYYTAAVKSMLQSWHNFFFVSAEPGGSGSVRWINRPWASGSKHSLPGCLG